MVTRKNVSIGLLRRLQFTVKTFKFVEVIILTNSYSGINMVVKGNLK